MKLAEALTLRGDLQKRAAQLHARLNNNAKVQEGESPAEDPRELLTELDGVMAQLEDLITRINLTNSAPLPEGGSITALLSRRDCLSRKVEVLRDFLACASSLVTRSTRGEIKVRSTVKVPELQKQVDALSRQLRELDVRLQGLNWTTELKE
ncbi:MAG: DIP1984 family protein [Angelakisella sp.]|jgi:hypothetical protein|nr:DIP1984 family protein [Angelakisella sp.]